MTENKRKRPDRAEAAKRRKSLQHKVVKCSLTRILNDDDVREEIERWVDVCQVIFAHCRPTFAVSQTIFSTSVAVSVVLKFQNLYPPVAYMATLVLIFELFSYSYSYPPEDNMHIAVYSMSFIFVFLLNVYVVYVLWDQRIRATFRFQIYLFCIIFAGYWIAIIASDTALGWSKHYYSFFFFEMMGLLAYIWVQANLATLI
jgi:hypothetical protein